MFKDLNRPEGTYGSHYDKMTNVRSRRAIQTFAPWENEAINQYITKQSRGEEYLLNELREMYENN